MAFKADASFLRFLSMGAIGVRATIVHLCGEGFAPIELERYCGSNKIWATKVKRLRMPDVLCVRTGLRVEVRAKSDLKIRMSDAPNNPERRWDAGLRDEDAVAFVPCNSIGQARVAGPPIYFLVSDLRASVEATRLGPPKSASEGAERDREWKSVVPSEDGEVLEVSQDRVRVQMASGRRQTYRLGGKAAYVRPGQQFLGRTSIIAAVVPRLAPLTAAKTRTWEPLRTLGAADPVDRYAAAKAIPHLEYGAARNRAALLAAMKDEPDDRVALEMAASAARLGAEAGVEHIVSTISNHSRGDLRMEAVLILTEVGTADAARELKRTATSTELAGSELRQAATWGLGKAGCRVYADLLDLLADEDEAVALHAIAAFGNDTPAEVIAMLVALLRAEDRRARAAASEALRLVGTDAVLRLLAESARAGDRHRAWVLATLGRLNATKVRIALAGDPLLVEVEPLLTLGPWENWLAAAEAASDLSFLLQQDIP